MEKRKIILDTDIGDDIDDAFALAMLLAMPAIQIHGVTTVYRNSVQRAKIVRALLQLFDAAIPVHAGLDEPEKEPVFVADFEVPAANGKPSIPHYYDCMAQNQVEAQPAVDYLLQSLGDSAPQTVSLVAIGPLTNLAAAYRRDPDIFRRVKQLLIMGGELKGSFAEWNIKCDPEAADTVFRCGLPIRLVTLECTRLCEFTEADIADFALSDKPVNVLLHKMMHKWMTDSRRSHLPIMYDGLTASCLTEQFCRFETRMLSVITAGADRGKLRECPQGSPIETSVSVDAAAFIRFLKSKLL